MTRIRIYEADIVSTCILPIDFGHNSRSIVKRFDVVFDGSMYFFP